MRQQTGKVTAQLKLKTLNDNPYYIHMTQARDRCFHHHFQTMTIDI